MITRAALEDMLRTSLDEMGLTIEKCLEARGLALERFIIPPAPADLEIEDLTRTELEELVEILLAE